MHSYHLDYMSMAMRTFAGRTLLAVVIWLAAINWVLAQTCRQVPMRAVQSFQSRYCVKEKDKAEFCARGCSRRIADYIYRLAWSLPDVCSYNDPKFDWDLRFQNFRAVVSTPIRSGSSGERCSRAPRPRVVCMCSVDVMLQRIVPDLPEQQPQQPEQAAMANNEQQCSDVSIAQRMNPFQFVFEIWYRNMVEQEAADHGERVQGYPATDAPQIPPDEHIWEVTRINPSAILRIHEHILCDASFSSSFADALIDSGPGSCTIKRPNLTNGAHGTLGIQCFGGPGMNVIVDRLKRLYEADPRARSSAPVTANNFIRLRNQLVSVVGALCLKIGLGQDFASVVGRQMAEDLAGASNLSPGAIAYIQQHPTQYYL
ncbi:hypothetical protein BCR37DRAFT_378296 [Protomyces lactucae-debilis]|uniref:Uncharacterized protein n=1 Tax=Protomyces lactucae-debilis TaxID=2754530 RepID=A0A1Y2FJZ4_PROLT|nr:uncharacterized protein BCR37DRAFT_378296 [Protomyces lactucae-debilis]ORY84291.1 hypothetical protein BCR37DRAFT_378296 [Protomyces lactucae-debilis]